MTALRVRKRPDASVEERNETSDENDSEKNYEQDATASSHGGRR